MTDSGGGRLMSRYDELELMTATEAFSRLTVEDLKPLVQLLGKSATKKGDLVALLTRTVGDRDHLRTLYGSFDELAQKAVQEATHDPDGVLDLVRFSAKYGRNPDFGGSGHRYSGQGQPTTLRLLFPRQRILATDVREALLTFVPEPPPLTVSSRPDLPPMVLRPLVNRGSYHRQHEKEVELAVRPTARAALHDVNAVLRLTGAGDLRVGDKTRRAAKPSLKAIAGVLLDGDFYAAGDQADEDWDPASDLQMRPFAWPLLLQAAGLAEATGTRLQLTAAGRKATTTPPHEVIRQVWRKWLKATLLDEFNRVSVIKGQQSKGRGLTALAGRRQEIVAVLKQCPVGQWVTVEELFRLLKVLTTDFQLTHDPWKLYLGEQRYGSFGNSGRHTWESLEGRYVMAFLFEYAATLGLVDVAYISPEDARNDYCDRWGADDLSCLSRYDGLMYLRINPLGAWCLGLAAEYEPETVAVERVLKVLPNRDVVATRAPGPGDVLLLERFAERTSEAVWRLEAGKVLEAVEQGLTTGELREFLAARCQDGLPHTVEVFLDDLEARAGQLADLGAARLIGCQDPVVARTLVSDRRLGKLCRLAGDRQLVFAAGDEAAVRRALRELGYALPPPG